MEAASAVSLRPAIAPRDRLDLARGSREQKIFKKYLKIILKCF